MSYPAEEAWIQRLMGLSAGLRQRDKDASQEIDSVIYWMRSQLDRRQSVKLWDPVKKAREDFASGKRAPFRPNDSSDFWLYVYGNRLFELTRAEEEKRRKK